jgi:DNA polymerase III alpha subunit
MKMANKIGFTLDEAEILRRIVGKKKTTEVRKWKKKIKEKVKENNLDPKISDILWQILEDSSNYSFNKSHSIAYAALSAATIYLKFKHPKEFFLSLLKMTRFEPDPISEISKIQKELDFFKIKLLPPHLIKSSLDFSIEGDDIRFGLLSIKGISEKSIDKLNNFRSTFSNKFEVFESANESGLNVGILCALIQAGALEEDFKQSRTKVVYEAQLWNILTPREKVIALKVAEENNYDLVSLVKRLNKTKNEKGKVFIKDSRMGTIRKKCEKYREIYDINKRSESFANWYYEKSLLGYTYGKTLQDIFRGSVDNLINLKQVNERSARTNVCFVATIDAKPISAVARSAKKTKYFKIVASDEFGSINTLMFNDKIDECKFSNNGLPKENEIVVVMGRKMDDAVFADVITVQDNKVYTKLSELRKDTS